MNEKLFLGMVEDNFEVESRLIESGFTPVMSVNDLNDTEKVEIFGDNTDGLDFSIEDAIEMTR